MSLDQSRSHDRLEVLIREALALSDDLGLAEVGIWLDTARVALSCERLDRAAGASEAFGSAKA